MRHSPTEAAHKADDGCGDDSPDEPEIEPNYGVLGGLA